MNHDSHGMGKHMLLMLICCLVPIGLILAVGALGISLVPLDAFLPYVIALMCPLMMVFMMKGMMQGGGEGHSHPHQVEPGHMEHQHTARASQIPETASVGAAQPIGASQDKCH